MVRPIQGLARINLRVERVGPLLPRTGRAVQVVARQVLIVTMVVRVVVPVTQTHQVVAVVAGQEQRAEQGQPLRHQIRVQERPAAWSTPIPQRRVAARRAIQE